MRLKNITVWLRDVPPRIHTQAISYIYRKPPEHYLGIMNEGKPPIVLIQGLNNKWVSMKGLIEKHSKAGHPIYTIAEIGSNNFTISEAAEVVKELLEKENLKNVVILAHSRGGLVGKYLISFLDKDKRIDKVIAVATPFWGSKLADKLPFKSVRELRTDSDTIKQLLKHKKENKKIISIYAQSDNVIWHENKCHLKEAQNYELEVKGHHSIIKSKKLKLLLEKII